MKELFRLAFIGKLHPSVILPPHSVDKAPVLLKHEGGLGGLFVLRNGEFLKYFHKTSHLPSGFGL